MSHHDERLLAEQLDAFLDAPGATPPPHRADAATVRALAATAMEPDPAFVARLEQRLRAMAPEAPMNRPRPRFAWLDALLRPAGRLAWIGLLALVVVTATLWLRSMSESPAGPSPEPIVAPTASPTIQPQVGPFGEPLRFTAPDPVVPEAEQPGSVWLLHEGSLLALSPTGQQHMIELQPPDFGDGREWTAWATTVSPDRRRLVALFATGEREDARNALTLYDRSTGVALVYRLPEGVYVILPDSAAWSPDGAALALELREALAGIALVDTISGAVRIWPSPPDEGIFHAPVGWRSPESLLLQQATVSGTGDEFAVTVALQERRTTDGTVISQFDGTEIGPATLSPDGQRLAFLSPDRSSEAGELSLVLRDWGTGAETATVLPFDWRRMHAHLAWAPDGSAVAVASTEMALAASSIARLHVVSAEGELLLGWDEPLARREQRTSDVHWSDDGEILIYFEDGSRERLSRLMGWKQIEGGWIVTRNEIGIPPPGGVVSGIVATVPGSAAAPVATPTPVVEGEPLPGPFAEGAALSVDSLSPDGRYVAYWEHSAEDLQQNPQVPSGAFRLYDTVAAVECNTIAAPRAPTVPWAPSLFWLPESEQNEFIVVLENGNVLWSYACSDEAAVITERFPETPEQMEPLDAGGNRWLLFGASSVWLLDWPAAEHARPVEGLPGGFEFYNDGYSISPDGSLVALSLVNQWIAAEPPRYTTYLLDTASGQARPLVEWTAREALGPVPGPLWLGNDRLLIQETGEEGPLLLTLAGGELAEREAIAATRFGTTLPESDQYSLIAAGTGDGEHFHLALGGLGADLALPALRLYHAETGEVETLPFTGDWPQFTPDGTALLLQRRETIEVAPGEFRQRYQTWRRPLDPPGGEAHLFVDGLMDSGAWSPDGRFVALWSPDRRTLLLLDSRSGALLRRWQSDQEGGQLLWTPDGSSLLIERVGESGEQLRLLPVGP